MAGMSSLVWFVFFFWLVVLISGPTTSVLSFQNHHHHHQCSWRSTRSIQSECRWKGRHSSSASSSWVLRASSSTTKAQQPNTETAAGSFFLEPSSAKKSSRAGSDGYSVLRQPATWEKDVDPTFDVPEWLLEESDDSSSSSNNNFYTNKDDEAWWTSQKQQQSRGTNNNNKASTTTTDTTPNEQHQAEQSLDLLQRSFDTLDFPRILQALYRECTTVPAKRLVQTAMQHQQQLHQPHESGGSSSSSGPRSNGSQNTTNTIETWVSVAHAPLLAETVEQSQDRYQAVQEMDCLLQGRIRSSDSHTDTAVAAQFRNRLGQYEPLFHRPPPFGNNNGFPWERIAEYAVAQSRVLDGPDLAGVADMLNAMENLVLWNRGLIAWTKQQQQQLSSQPTTTTAAAASTVPTTKDDFQFEQLSRIASCISINSTLQDLLNNAFETSTSNSGGGSDSGGRLSGTTFPTVGRLRSEIRLLKADIIQTLDGLLALPSMQSKLSLESGGPIYSEVQGSGRLVVPVDRKYASTMTLGIVHDTSRSGKTVYVEPNEIIAPTNELKQAEAKLRAEEARIWRFLTEQILVNRVEIETSVAAIGQLDLIMARLKLGEKISGTVPIVKDEGVILLRNAKHPVLVLRGLDAVIGSDIDLGRESNQGLVLTGPNAGGKTVIMKMLGLLALMARCGIPVPADKASNANNEDSDLLADSRLVASVSQPRVDFFNPVLADIGDLQSVGGDLSTFSGHMLVCREVLNNSGRNALVLMDELGSGTDPNQGVAIAQALLEAVVATGARVAITTHYLQLKQLAAADNRFSVAGMQFVNGRPTYKLLPGTVGESFALAVAERLGLPQPVLARANELLDSETRQMGDLIREMEDQKAILDQQVVEFEIKRREMADMETKMKEEAIRLENKQLDARRIEARKFAKMLEEKEAVLEAILEKLKSDPSRRVLAKSWDDIKFVKRDALNEAENIPSVLARKKKIAVAMELASTDLVPIAEMREKPILSEGDKVIICEQGPMFGREATIIKALDSRLEVKVNNMNVSFKLSQVALSNGQKVFQSGAQHSPGGSTRLASSRSRAVEQALASESNNIKRRSGIDNHNNSSDDKSFPNGVTMRTESNTVDVRGCNLMEAQEKVRSKFSSALMTGRSVVFVLHGHGTGGVLKGKIRAWLQSERQLVKEFGAADRTDGGDALTRVRIR